MIIALFFIIHSNLNYECIRIFVRNIIASIDEGKCREGKEDKFNRGCIVRDITFVTKGN